MKFWNRVVTCLQQICNKTEDGGKVAPLLTRFNSNPAWISNYIHYKMLDEITNPFLNFNGATVEV